MFITSSDSHIRKNRVPPLVYALGHKLGLLRIVRLNRQSLSGSGISFIPESE
jgi:hypothetical protein